MQVVMQGTEVFAAAGTVQNALTGERYERPPFAAMGDLYMQGSAINLLTAEINVGGVSVSGQVNIGGQNRLPLVPDDLLVGDWEAPAGSLIQLRVTASAAASAFWRVELENIVAAQG